MAIQHMALVRFKPDVTPTQIDDVFRQLAELQNCIPGILYYAGGPYASPEGLNQDYTHGFLMTFATVDARDQYLPHPEHERVKNAVIPLIEKVVVFDFEDTGN
jgi:hypothetical protein